MTEQPTAITEAPFPSRRSLRQAEQAQQVEQSRRARRAPQSAHGQRGPSARFTAVDGFRGLAILSVLFYHSGVTSRGLFGVDVFFVVSGFFVTLLALRELRRTGRLRLGAFFGRRARRILPGVVLALLVTLLLVAHFGTSAEFERAKHTAIAGMLQVANWQQLAANQSYWDSLGAINPLGQMWSLSITEQFYLVWPVVLLILWFVTRHRATWLITALITLTVAAGAVAPILFDGTNSDRLYLGTDSRAVAFIAGAAAAAIVVAWEARGGAQASRRPRAGLTLASLVLFALLVGASVAVHSYHDAWIYRGGLAVVAVVAAVLTATLCLPGNLLARVFHNRFLVGVGKMSYVLFLFHLPVYWMLQTLSGGGVRGWAMFAIGAPVTLAVSWLVHRLITEPIRIRPWSRAGGVVAAVVACTAVVAAGLYLPSLQSLPGTAAEAASLTSGTGEPAPIPTLRPGIAGAAPRAVFVGDSMAVDWAAALTANAPGAITTQDEAYGGCGIFDSDEVMTAQGWTQGEADNKRACWPWQDKLRLQIAKGDVDFVVAHIGWDAAQQRIDGSWMRPCDAAWQQRYTDKIGALLSIVRAAKHPATVLLATDQINTVVVGDKHQVGCFNAAIRKTAAQEPGVRLLDFNAYICPKSGCRTKTADGQPLTSDGLHLTAAGEAEITPWLMAQLAAAQPAPTPVDSAKPNGDREP